MIAFEHVSMEYMAGSPILHDISLELEPGSFHFLAGRSGAGKSTLLSLLWLQRRPTSGSIFMFGEDITKLPREELPRVRRKIGIVLQDYRLLEHMTVAQNVALPLKVAGESQETIDAKVKELLQWIELGDFHGSKPATISGGQKQRTAIARAVVTNPTLLLADEPTGNLDPSLALKFMYLFEELHKGGTTVVVATHDEQLISQFNHPVLRLKDGKLIKEVK